MGSQFVSSSAWRRLMTEMSRLGIGEKDLIEHFVRGTGAGGQKLNKTSSCVYLRHSPSGIEVKCQRTRSREVNRVLARRELCERLEERLLGERSRRLQAQEKIRRQKRRRSRRQKERLLEQKHRQSSKKDMRRRVDGEG